MAALILLCLNLVASLFKSRGRLEAENAAGGLGGMFFTLVLLRAKHLNKLRLKARGSVMPIGALLQQAAFDPEATHILTTAFDKAWDKFKSSGNALADDACAPSTRALLAKRLIEIAQSGERNIDRLVENGVAYLQGVK
jgi:hypothetical protein